MKLNKISLAIGALALSLGAATARVRTQDVAFTFRMGAGFPGDVNRTHPFSVLPGLMNTATQAPRLYGDPVLYSSSGTPSYRGFVAGDVTTPVAIAGVLVRPYPVQQQSGGMSAAIGTGSPGTTPCVIDVLREGYIIAKNNDFVANPVTQKGQAVYVWIAANSGVHVQGGFETTLTGGSSVLVSNASWNGPGDSAGVGEIEVRAA